MDFPALSAALRFLLDGLWRCCWRWGRAEEVDERPDVAGVVQVGPRLDVAVLAGVGR